MSCEKCNGKQLLSVTAKCADLCWLTMESIGLSTNGYVPKLPGLSEDDKYIDFVVCTDCGVIQGFAPMSADTLVLMAEDAIEEDL